MLPSEPPYDDEKPKDEDKEDDVPQPATPLTLSHVVHAPERARENARRFRKGVVLPHQHAEEEKKIMVCQSAESRLRLHAVILVACVDDDDFTRRHTHIYPEIEESDNTHHLGELDGRLAHFIPNPDRNLNSQTKSKKKHERQQLISSEVKER